MLADFHFQRPGWLLVLIPVLWLLVAFVRRQTGQGAWTQVCDAPLLPFILKVTPGAQRRPSWLMAGLAGLAAVLALAGPTWQRLPSPAFRNDSALVIALDLSKSMDANDIKPSRISRARFKLSDILQQRKDGQTALLVYSGDAFTVTPLTTDTATIQSQLAALNTDIMPSPGSNTEVAISKAVALLQQASLTQGHILLMTDGVEALSHGSVKKLLGDYRLSILAIGTPEGAPIPLPGGGFLQDASGNMVVSKLDMAELAALANAGRGVLQTVTADDADVDRLSALFNQASLNADGGATDVLLQQWDEKGPWLLWLVLPWAALQFRKGLWLLAGLCLLPYTPDASALDWQSWWLTADQRAQQAFQQQQYQQAADQFEHPAWRAAAQYRAGQYEQAAETLKNSRSADDHYNRGNALAKAGQIPQAIEAYQQALQIDAQHADAKHNKALLEQMQQEQSQQNQQNQQSQQDQQNQSASSAPNTAADGAKDQKQNQANSGQMQDQAQNQPAADESPHSQPPKAPESTQDKPDEARRSPDAALPEKPGKADETSALTAAEQSETARANEQLLKRIPDEPTGLLKRKFRFLYGQREPPPHNGPDW